MILIMLSKIKINKRKSIISWHSIIVYRSIESNWIEFSSSNIWITCYLMDTYFPIFIRVMVRLTSLIVIFFSCWPDFDQISLEFFSVILLLWVIQREKCKDKKEMNKHTYSPLVWNSHSSTYLKRNRMKLNCKSSYSVLINIIHYSFYTQSFQIFLTILFSSLFIFFHFILVSFFFFIFY
jgi:hypothetical protein